VSTFLLVLIMLNPQGHTIYRSPEPAFATLHACEIRAGQLQLHAGVKGTMCVEQYHGSEDPRGDNYARK
jgi:hypothetical protein